MVFSTGRYTHSPAGVYGLLSMIFRPVATLLAPLGAKGSYARSFDRGSFVLELSKPRNSCIYGGIVLKHDGPHST